MDTTSACGGTCGLGLWAAIALALAGCATQEPVPAPAPAPAPPPVVAAPEPAKPAPPPEPQLTPAQAKQQAQKLTIEAVDQLQNGESTARAKMLDQAQTLDPANDLARKMQEQIKADPQKELGAVFFRYTVQRDDSLSKIAQTYLGDRFRFYILAKYNDIANPSQLAAGQVIKVPGRGPQPRRPRPPRRRRPHRQHARAAEPAEDVATAAAIEAATPRNASMALMQQGTTCRRPAICRAPTTRSARRRCAIRATATRCCSAMPRARRSRELRTRGDAGVPAAEPRPGDREVGPRARARSGQPEGQARARARDRPAQEDEREVRREVAVRAARGEATGAWRWRHSTLFT